MKIRKPDFPSEVGLLYVNKPPTQRAVSVIVAWSVRHPVRSCHHCEASLHRFCHQVFTSYKAKDGYLVVLATTIKV